MIVVPQNKSRVLAEQEFDLWIAGVTRWMVTVQNVNPKIRHGMINQ
jgi:hypothetical protein